MSEISLDSVSITALDIGARGGTKRDLGPIDSAVQWVLFEPEAEAARELKESTDSRTTVVPIALGGDTRRESLNLYRKRGCSSFLTANRTLAERYERGDYFICDDSVFVETQTLDNAAHSYDFLDAAFIKIDVQGAELSVFNGGPQLLDNSVVAIRTEVSFISLYDNQPLFSDIAHMLARHGFSPYQFLEMHAWRRDTRTKYPNVLREQKSMSPELSRGQMVHGDVLFMKEIEDMGDVPSRARLGLIAYAFGHLDVTARALSDSETQSWLYERTGVEAEDMINSFSREHRKREAKGRRRQRRKALLKRIKGQAV